MAAVGLVASGCVTARPYDVVTSHNAKITVQRVPDQKVLLRINDNPPVSLPSAKDAQIGLLWGATKSDFVVLRGPTEDCPDAAWVASITGGAVSVHALGACQDKLTFTQIGDKLLIQAMPPHGSPTLTVFRDGDADAYAVRVGVATRRRTGPPGPGIPAQGSPAPSVAGTPALADETSVPLPPVSARVGDNVVPPLVGAGPLPAGAGQPVPPFETSSQAK